MNNPAAIAAITAAIRERGPLNFADFMQIALYHPRHGYYRRARIGREGDFFTAVSTGPVWGRIWARHFRKMLAVMPTPEPQASGLQRLEKRGSETSHHGKTRPGIRHPASGVVYEFGGNTGQFRDDVLKECPELDHRIMEVDDMMPDSMDGIVFSNELIDAMPFHRLRRSDGIWREIFVGQGEHGDLIEIEGDPSEAVRSQITHGESQIPDGWEIECRPAAQAWIRDIAARLTRGLVITVDYGYTRDEYFAKPRLRGTWRTYFNHTQTNDALANIGGQDITADVDFTRFIAAGEDAGLETIFFKDLSHALIEIGRDVIEQITTRDAGRPSRDRNAIQQLLHPSMMGTRFRVLIQRKPWRSGGFGPLQDKVNRVDGLHVE